MKDIRCKKCNKLLAKYEGGTRLEIKCPRCGVKNFYKDNIQFSRDAADSRLRSHPELLFK